MAFKEFAFIDHSPRAVTEMVADRSFPRVVPAGQERPAFNCTYALGDGTGRDSVGEIQRAEKKAQGNWAATRKNLREF